MNLQGDAVGDYGHEQLVRKSDLTFALFHFSFRRVASRCIPAATHSKDGNDRVDDEACRRDETHGFTLLR